MGLMGTVTGLMGTVTWFYCQLWKSGERLRLFDGCMAVRSQERKGNMTKRTQLLSNPPPQTFFIAFPSASRPPGERAALAFVPV